MSRDPLLISLDEYIHSLRNARDDSEIYDINKRYLELIIREEHEGDPDRNRRMAIFHMTNVLATSCDRHREGNRIIQHATEWNARVFQAFVHISDMSR